jgi:hypothetical protein
VYDIFAIGTWYHNKRQGYGIYYYANGDTYEGEWMDGQRHGQGIYDYSHVNTKVHAIFERKIWTGCL